MNKFLCFVLCFVILLSSPVFYAGDDKGEVFAGDTPVICYYVDDVSDGDGSLSSPFSTLEDARDAVRALRKNGTDAPVTVYIRGGEYYRVKPFELYEADKNITFRNYPGEKVLITGGKKISENDIEKVTDEVILSKIIDPKARGRIYRIDLSGYVDELEYPYEWSSELSGWDETMFSNHLRVVVNGSGLDKSRWPNTTEAELTTKSMSNPGGGIAAFVYEDVTDRAKKWSAESIENLMIRGHFIHDWTYSLQYASVDPDTKTVTTRNATKSSWTNNRKFYFVNLIEEIDMPGESYTDVEEKCVYFYGYGDMDNPEVYVPVSTNCLVSIVKSKNITFSGIDFAHSKSKLFDCYSGSFITVDNCDFTHFGGRNYFYGNHITVKNCYFYGNAVTMIDTRDFDGVYPGNSSNIINQKESACNVFENNKFNLGNEVNLYSSSGLASTQSKGLLIKNNEFYNSAGCVLSVGASIDSVIEENHFHDCARWTGDMGVIYWHSNPASFGHEIRYNFFENNGSSYADGWQQSIFNDCCSTGPWVHHNVFNQGTWGTSEGGRKFAIKSFGGQFSMIENNVFIDTPYAVQFQTWYPCEDDGQQTGWWLNMFGKSKDGDVGSEYTESALLGNYALMNNSGIRQKYTGTPWEDYFKYVNSDMYNLVRYSDRNADSEHLLNIAKLYAPMPLNTFRNNVMVGGVSNTAGVDPTFFNGTEENTYFSSLENADVLFENYKNGRFSFTEKGIYAVKSAVTDFENFELSDVGVQPFSDGTITENVGGNYSVAGNARVEINDGYATPVYEFSDADGDGEGRTLVEWYFSNTPDGQYRLINYGGTYDLPCEAFAGRYVKCKIYTYDNNGVDGEVTETEPVFLPFGTDNSEVEEGRVIREWRMEYNDGVRVTNLGLVCSAINKESEPVKSGFATGKLVEKLDGTAVGVDGSGAVSFRADSYVTNAFMGLIDYSISDKDYVKPGFTYFKSAMMKLNPETTDKDILLSGKNIRSFHEFGQKGFTTDASGFKAALDTYYGSGTVPSYDWNGVKTGTVKNNIKTDWVRVTDAMYTDYSLAEPFRDRSGWVIWGHDWNTSCWTGNWELVVDDYILLEVPNTALKSIAYPVAYNPEVLYLSKVNEVFSGTMLTADAEYYDVNALINGTDDNFLTYRWQKSTDGQDWEYIEGETSENYKPQLSDKYVRVEIKAVSRTQNIDKTSELIFSEPVYSQSVKIADSESSVVVMLSEFVNESFEYHSIDSGIRMINGNSIVCYCQVNDYNDEITDYGIVLRHDGYALKIPGSNIDGNGVYCIRLFGPVVDLMLYDSNYELEGYID